MSEDFEVISDTTKTFQQNPNAIDDGHAMGAIQDSIASRMHFMGVGIFCLVFAMYGLYVTWSSWAEQNPSVLSMVMGSIFLIILATLGFRMISYSTCRINLRQKGLELKNIRGKESFFYDQLTIQLEEVLENKNRSLVGSFTAKRGRSKYQYVWVCTIHVEGREGYLVLKSTQYKDLKEKIKRLMAALNM